jgi:hypothetical protein
VTRSLSAAWLVALVAIFALYAWAIRQDPTPPMRMPDTVTGVTPIDAVQHVYCDNCQAAATATATYAPRPTPTPAYPACPAKNQELCLVPADVVTVTVAPIPECTTATMATMAADTVCRWMEATSTPMKGPFR